MADPGIQVVLDLIDEGFDQESWHGPNLRGSIRGVKLDEAVWRQNPAYHNIWEITLHAAYWKYTVWRRLAGDKRGTFPRKGTDWYPRPSDDPADTWQDDVKLLDEIHLKLREAVETLKPSLLSATPGGSSVSNSSIIRGIAFHDIYHAGQIQTIRQLYASRT